MRWLHTPPDDARLCSVLFYNFCYSYTFIDNTIMLYHNLLPSALSLSPSGDNSTLSLTLIALSNPFVEVRLYPSLIVLACVLYKKSLLDSPMKGTSGTIPNGELLDGNTAAACCCWHPVITKTFYDWSSFQCLKKIILESKVWIPIPLTWFLHKTWIDSDIKSWFSCKLNFWTKTVPIFV